MLKESSYNEPKVLSILLSAPFKLLVSVYPDDEGPLDSFLPSKAICDLTNMAVVTLTIATNEAAATS